MLLAKFQRRLIVALCGVALATLFAGRGAAQQITYYDFNTPQASGQSSNNCAQTPALFCFNSVGAGLSFIEDNSYTTSIDPNETNGSAYALQLTQNIGSQSSSVWYSIPQDVKDGFTAWYAFKITPDITGANCCTADGLAFVIQNAAGGKTDSISGSSETGSGLTVLGGGGGSLGYGGIDNSVALEMDTFPDSWDPWDIAVGYNDDNHMALQSCGPGVANSPAHYAPPNNTSEPTNCLVTLSGARAIAPNPNSSSTGSTVTLADGNPHQVVVIYNGPSDSPANYLYVYLDPAFTLGTHTPVTGSTPIFSGPFNIANYVNLNNGTAYVGFTAANGGNYEQHEIMGFTFAPHSFGIANVCPSGQTTPAPCSNTFPVAFNFTAASTPVSQILAFTQGAQGLDFSAPNSGQCIGDFTSGQSCIVKVTFTPTAPGLRMGAVELLGDTGNLLATQLVYGIGYGPVTAFGPATQAPIYSGNAPFFAAGVAVDAAGDLFIAENQGTGSDIGQVVKVAPNSTQTIFGTSLPKPPYYPQGLAVDGAGNLYIADNNRNAVIEIPAECNSSCAQEQILSNPLGLRSQLGVAVDGAGDVFFSDFLDGEVAEIPANGSVETVVYNPGSGYLPGFTSNPIGLAVDAAGDLFIADYGFKKVLEIPSGCTNSTCWIQVGTGWDRPEAVAVDAAGDVFVADELPQVVEVPAGCNNSACQITISNTLAYGVAVDAKGDIFIPDLNGNRVVEINKSQPPTLNFPTPTTAGSSDATDGAKLASLQNVGNTTLSFPVPSSGDNPSIGPDFSLFSNGEGDCPLTTASSSSPGTLAVGALCVYSITFYPMEAGSLSESLVLTDNNLNGISPSPAATQTIALNGTGLAPSYTLAVSTAGSGSGTVSGTNCSTASYPSGTAVTCTESPAVGSQFAGWSGTCSGTGSCSFPLSSNSTVVANFSLAQVTVPNVVGLTQTTQTPAAATAITASGLLLGTVTTQYSDTVVSGNVISESPASGTIVSGGTLINLIVSNGVPPASDQLVLENNYFVTGDYASAGVTLRGAPIVNGMATSTITIPSGTSPGSVPDGADIVAAYLYWEAIENTSSPSSTNATFLGYSITGQQIGRDVPSYNDGTSTGTLRAYRADVNNYFPISPGPNAVRTASGSFTVSLPDGGATMQIPEGASLVVIYRVLSPNFPLKSVVLYNGSVTPTAAAGPIPQAVQGFYDAVGGSSGTGEVTNIYAGSGGWNNISNSQTLGQSNQYIDTLNTGNAYAAVVLSTPVNNSDGDGILDAWKAGPPAGDPNSGNPGYYDVNTGLFVSLPGATLHEKDLFVQFDYMCSAFVEGTNTCDFTQQNTYPSPDAQGNDPLAMVTQAFLNIGVHLHLKPGNAILESTYTCMDPVPANGSLCEFPSTASDPQPGVVAWNGGVELSKVWPANFANCTSSPSTESCTPRFPFGQKDSYHYVLFGYSLAIPAWNSWFGSLTGITVSGTQTSIQTTGLGSTCPSRITISGVQGNPALNGVYNTAGCDSGLTTIYVSTPSGATPGWIYPNNKLPEPVIGITSGTVTSISGYSNVGGSDSVVSLGLWTQNSNQDMSKPATVIAGTLFHELGHTLGLTHGGRYYDTQGSYLPTFEANCKPNYQSSMNYLFQLDGVGSGGTIAYSSQTLEDQNRNPLSFASLGNVTSLTDISGVNAAIGSSSWYVPYNPATTTASPATMHCDGTPLNNSSDLAVRVNGTVDPLSPTWSDSENITFDGPAYTTLRGYNDLANLDLRQVGATSDEFASLANATSYSSAGVTFGGGGGVTFGGGGGVTFGGGGGVTFGGGGGVTFGGGGGVTFGGGGGVTFGGGGGVTFGGGGGVTFGGGGGAPTELDYLTANSIVRPPSSPGMTPTPPGVPTGIIITWNAPSFGVVETYTILRSVNGAPAVAVGSVSGVNGNPPGTTWTDFNPVTGTVLYTITTTLLPVPIDPTQRQSQPSPPAVMKSEQSIALSLPGSVAISSSPLTIYATAETNGTANGLQVNFVATGSCSIASQSIASGISSASLNLNSTGSCNITASQSGSSSYDAASSVSGSFTILSSGQSTQTQTINLAQLPGVQYGSLFSVSATSSSGIGVTFAASGPCTVSSTTGTATGTTTGAGKCTITATAPANGNYSTATTVESFTIFQAVLKVTAINLSSVYGQPLPSLAPVLGTTYTLNGFIGNDGPSAVNGAPALSTTAMQGSGPGSYPITVSTGTLAAANYSFLYVPGTLTITGPLITVSPSAIAFGTVSLGSITTKNITVTNTGSAPATISDPILSIVKGGNSNEFVAVNLCLTPLVAGKSCTITIAFLAGPYYTPQTATLEIMDNAPGSPQPVTLSATVLKPQTITFTNVPSSAAYNSSFTVTATGGGSGNPVTFTASGACSVPPGSATYIMTNGTGTCSVIANQAGNSTYAAAAQVTKTVTAALAAQTITLTNPPPTAAYKTSFAVAATASSGLAVTFTSSGACSNAGATYTMTSGTGTCSVIANQAGNSNYSAAPTVTKTVNATYSSATLTPGSLIFGTVSANHSSAAQTATLKNAGTTPLIISSIAFTGSNAGNFTQSNTCPSSSSSLAAGSSCTISVTFKSSGTTASASLTVTDNTAPPGMQTVSVSGN
jgi:MBG domain (YGX type)/Divergent InlB B-repeat domain/PASTA domain